MLTWVGAALFLALGLDPLVSWLEKHKFPRGLAILTVLVGVLAVFTGSVLAIIPVIAEQVGNAITAVPELIEGIQNGEVRDNLLSTLPWLPIDDILEQHHQDDRGDRFRVRISAAGCSPSDSASRRP